MSESVPLTEMSSNIQESDAAGRKRSHDEFTEDAQDSQPTQDAKRPLNAATHPAVETLLPPGSNRRHTDSPPPQPSPALTDGGNSTTTPNSASPQTPSRHSADGPNDKTSSSTTPNAAPMAQKRKRLTAAEKEAREKEMAEKKKEREEKAAARAADHARAEEEKAARAKEREEKRKKKEEEDKMKAQEREEKKRKKEEEQRLIQEAKEKKERQQPKLASFFVGPATPRKAATPVSSKVSPLKTATADTSSTPDESEYEKMFKPFFVKDNTTLAPPATLMDQETRDAKAAILDQFVNGQRSLENPAASFDPTELLTLPAKPPPRGRLHHPVKHIMEKVYREAEGSAVDDANKAMEGAKAKLSSIPLKVISFSQDVRPPYYGTATLKPFILGKEQMRKLARLSTGRRLPLEYDYDSEAEWQDDEGEDLDGDDGEEEIDDEDDMDGFLDDTEDVGPARRIFINTMEPESSGICFEDENRNGPNAAVRPHKMEIIIQNCDEGDSLDPWSTSYWEPETKTATAASSNPAPASMPPPASKTDGFASLKAGVVNGSGSGSSSAKLVKDEILNDVKKAILDNRGLSKIGIIEFVFQQFRDSASRTEVKNTIELVAEKRGTGRVKEWALKTGHDVAV